VSAFRTSDPRVAPNRRRNDREVDGTRRALPLAFSLATKASSLQFQYLGGSNLDSCSAVAVDAARNTYVTGGTLSSNFPTTPNSFKRRNRNGVYDAFLSRFAEV
jgi:hypothetical protein